MSFSLCWRKLLSRILYLRSKHCTCKHRNVDLTLICLEAGEGITEWALLRTKVTWKTNLATLKTWKFMKISLIGSIFVIGPVRAPIKIVWVIVFLINVMTSGDRFFIFIALNSSMRLFQAYFCFWVIASPGPQFYRDSDSIEWRNETMWGMKILIIFSAQFKYEVISLLGWVFQSTSSSKPQIIEKFQLTKSRLVCGLKILVISVLRIRRWCEFSKFNASSHFLCLKGWLNSIGKFQLHQTRWCGVSKSW